MLNKINTNFPKARFTYMTLAQKFRKQCAPNFENLLQYKLLNIKVTVHWEDKRAMKFEDKRLKKLAIPSRKWINTKVHSNNIFNLILKEELSDTDSEALIEEL